VAIGTDAEGLGRKLDELPAGNALVNAGSLAGTCEVNIRLETRSVGEKVEGEASEKVLGEPRAVVHRWSRAMKAGWESISVDQAVLSAVVNVSRGRNHSLAVEREACQI
jgi:hypothetical protein